MDTGDLSLPPQIAHEAVEEPQQQQQQQQQGKVEDQHVSAEAGFVHRDEQVDLPSHNAGQVAEQLPSIKSAAAPHSAAGEIIVINNATVASIADVEQPISNKQDISNTASVQDIIAQPGVTEIPHDQTHDIAITQQPAPTDIDTPTGNPSPVHTVQADQATDVVVEHAQLPAQHGQVADTLQQSAGEQQNTTTGTATIQEDASKQQHMAEQQEYNALQSIPIPAGNTHQQIADANVADLPVGSQQQASEPVSTTADGNVGNASVPEQAAADSDNDGEATLEDDKEMGTNGDSSGYALPAPDQAQKPFRPRGKRGGRRNRQVNGQQNVAAAGNAQHHAQQGVDDSGKRVTDVADRDLHGNKKPRLDDTSKPLSPDLRAHLLGRGITVTLDFSNPSKGRQVTANLPAGSRAAPARPAVTEPVPLFSNSSARAVPTPRTVTLHEHQPDAKGNKKEPSLKVNVAIDDPSKNYLHRLFGKGVIDPCAADEQAYKEGIKRMNEYLDTMAVREVMSVQFELRAHPIIEFGRVNLASLRNKQAWLLTTARNAKGKTLHDVAFSRTYTLGCYRLEALLSTKLNHDLLAALPVRKRKFCLFTLGQVDHWHLHDNPSAFFRNLVHSFTPYDMADRLLAQFPLPHPVPKGNISILTTAAAAPGPSTTKRTPEPRAGRDAPASPRRGGRPNAPGGPDRRGSPSRKRERSRERDRGRDRGPNRDRERDRDGDHDRNRRRMDDGPRGGPGRMDNGPRPPPSAPPPPARHAPVSAYGEYVGEQMGMGQRNVMPPSNMMGQQQHQQQQHMGMAPMHGQPPGWQQPMNNMQGGPPPGQPPFNAGNQQQGMMMGGGPQGPMRRAPEVSGPGQRSTGFASGPEPNRATGFSGRPAGPPEGPGRQRVSRWSDQHDANNNAKQHTNVPAPPPSQSQVWDRYQGAPPPMNQNPQPPPGGFGPPGGMQGQVMHGQQQQHGMGMPPGHPPNQAPPPNMGPAMNSNMGPQMSDAAPPQNVNSSQQVLEGLLAAALQTSQPGSNHVTEVLTALVSNALGLNQAMQQPAVAPHTTAQNPDAAAAVAAALALQQQAALQQQMQQQLQQIQQLQQQLQQQQQQQQAMAPPSNVLQAQPPPAVPATSIPSGVQPMPPANNMAPNPARPSAPNPSSIGINAQSTDSPVGLNQPPIRQPPVTQPPRQNAMPAPAMQAKGSPVPPSQLPGMPSNQPQHMPQRPQAPAPRPAMPAQPTLQRPVQCRLKVRTAGAASPAPWRSALPAGAMQSNTQDARCLGMCAWAVAEGAAATRQLGIDSAPWAQSLANAAVKAAEAAVATAQASGAPVAKPGEVLSTALSSVTGSGAATCCLAYLCGSELHIGYIGTCGAVVLRAQSQKGEMSAVNPWRPYTDPARRSQQLASQNIAGLVGGTAPRTAAEECITLQPGDIMILGTHGLFDMVWLHGPPSANLCRELHALSQTQDVEVQMVATQLTNLAASMGSTGALSGSPLCLQLSQEGRVPVPMQDVGDNTAVVAFVEAA